MSNLIITMNSFYKLFLCLGGDVRVLPHQETQVVHVSPTETTSTRVEKTADTMVKHELITREEAKTQIAAINNFFQGKLSYAEMRAIAG